MVLQAVADARRKFITVEVDGRRGKQNDSGTLGASTLLQLIERNKYKIPMAKSSGVGGPHCTRPFRSDAGVHRIVNCDSQKIHSKRILTINSTYKKSKNCGRLYNCHL
ncbi:hypothetical protein EVAR_40452_1 [Eumeta japonica]|uniref:Uncharacterized protein n=1 Tax=Eumeta variegata TaxID=151549 RepID=A0A4C1WYM5_EUMVA|nr:hypothetical protein EVAR_40452_1 [Eumeta japonica]